MTDRKFIYADCPINENGHRMAKTRDGRNVRLLADDMPGSYPIAGVFAGNTTVNQWRADGRFYAECDQGTDIMPAKRVRVFWVNLYPDKVTKWESKKYADCHATSGRIGPARRIEIEE